MYGYFFSAAEVIKGCYKYPGDQAGRRASAEVIEGLGLFSHVDFLTIAGLSNHLEKYFLLLPVFLCVLASVWM